MIPIYFECEKKEVENDRCVIRALNLLFLSESNVHRFSSHDFMIQETTTKKAEKKKTTCQFSFDCVKAVLAKHNYSLEEVNVIDNEINPLNEGCYLVKKEEEGRGGDHWFSFNRFSNDQPIWLFDKKKNKPIRVMKKARISPKTKVYRLIKDKKPIVLRPLNELDVSFFLRDLLLILEDIEKSMSHVVNNLLQTNRFSDEDFNLETKRFRLNTDSTHIMRAILARENFDLVKIHPPSYDQKCLSGGGGGVGLYLIRKETSWFGLCRFSPSATTLWHFDFAKERPMRIGSIDVDLKPNQVFQLVETNKPIIISESTIYSLKVPGHEARQAGIYYFECGSDRTAIHTLNNLLQWNLFSIDDDNDDDISSLSKLGNNYDVESIKRVLRKKDYELDLESLSRKCVHNDYFKSFLAPGHYLHYLHGIGDRNYWIGILKLEPNTDHVWILDSTKAEPIFTTLDWSRFDGNLKERVFRLAYMKKPKSKYLDISNHQLDSI